MKKLSEMLPKRLESENSSSLPQWLTEKKHEIIKRYGDAHQFAVTFNPDYQYECAMDIEKSLYGPAPTLRQLASTYTQHQNMAWLTAHLNDINNFCGVKAKMEIEQMKQVAAIMLIQYPYIKASEVLLFFYRFKAGLHGQLYGVVDPLMITTAFIEFVEWRSTERSRIESLYKQQQRAEMVERSKKTAITREEYEQRKNKRHEYE